MYTFLITLLVLNSLVLIAAVLLQSGKGGGLSANFGGASSSSSRERSLFDLAHAAATLSAIVDEISLANVSERGATRGDDKFSETAMEDRKREGYF